MTTAFGWIGQLVSWFGEFVPRWELIRKTERAVKFLPGGKTRYCKPGIVWYWPATTELEIHPVVRQVIELQPQTLMTKDEVPVYASGVLVYKITDLHTFLVDNYDAADSLDDLGQIAVREAIVRKTFDTVQASRAEIDNLLTREAAKALTSFGVEVEACRLTDFTRARVLNLVGSSLASVNLGT